MMRWTALSIFAVICRNKYMLWSLCFHEPVRFCSILVQAASHSLATVAYNIRETQSTIIPHTRLIIAIMSKFLATALLATAAAAQLETNIWIPGAADSNISFVASVIEENAGTTTMSLAFAEDVLTDQYYYAEAPQTVTVAGSTSVGYSAVASEPFGVSSVAFTISLGCTRANADAVATCSMYVSSKYPLPKRDPFY